MDHIDNKLTSQLYRIDCPSPELLGEYHLSMLPDGQAQDISKHVVICPHCSQELAQLDTYLTDLAPELNFSLREKVQILVAKLMPNGLDLSFPSAASQAMALRGNSDDAPLMFEAGEFQLNLEIQDDPAAVGHKSILGLLIGGDESIFEAQLWQNGRSLQKTAVNDLGNFIFSRVQPGTYDLILSQHVTEIHVQALKI